MSEKLELLRSLSDITKRVEREREREKEGEHG